MNYCDLNEDDKHIESLVRWILEEVMRSGGDGDFIWYSQFYSILDIYKIVDRINNELRFKWHLDIGDRDLHWSYGQSSILITNDEEKFNNRPSWQQGALVL